MKLTWKKEKNVKKRPFGVVSQYPNLPFEQRNNEFDTEFGSRGEPGDDEKKAVASVESSGLDTEQLAQSFREQGDKLAEEGKYREALEKWEAALNLMPDTAALHEQKAQVLLEIGDAWSALKAATRAIDLEPSWAEAWITLGRSQLNFGEPDSAIDSFDRALALKVIIFYSLVSLAGLINPKALVQYVDVMPDSKEAKEDRETAMHHIKRRKQLHSSGLSSDNNRFMVGDN